MASYYFRCRNESCELLDQEVKVIKSMNEDNPSCDKCGVKMNQIYKNSGAFILKGRGWNR